MELVKISHSIMPRIAAFARLGVNLVRYQASIFLSRNLQAALDFYRAVAPRKCRWTMGLRSRRYSFAATRSAWLNEPTLKTRV